MFNAKCSAPCLVIVVVHRGQFHALRHRMELSSLTDDASGQVILADTKQARRRELAQSTVLGAGAGSTCRFRESLTTQASSRSVPFCFFFCFRRPTYQTKQVSKKRAEGRRREGRRSCDESGAIPERSPTPLHYPLAHARLDPSPNSDFRVDRCSTRSRCSTCRGQ